MEPPPNSRFVFAPANQPRAGSYVVVDTRTFVCAARGNAPAGNAIPFSVTLFCDGSSPITEKPPAVGVSEGSMLAIAFKSPANSGGSAPVNVSAIFSAAPVPVPGSTLRVGFGFCASTRMPDSCCTIGLRLTFTTSTESSFVRVTRFRNGVKPILVT